MHRLSHGFVARALIGGLVLSGTRAAALRADGAELRTLVDNGRELDYLIALPPGFDGRSPHPVLLALPPGDQSRAMAQQGLDLYWEAEGTARGWVVVSPIAPRGKSFHSGPERAIPFLLDEVARSVTFEGGRAHLAGVSNGGKSAFRVATEYPDRFLSLTVLPGFPPDERATLGLRSLRQLSGGIALYVGDGDSTWIAPMRTVKQRLDAYGVVNTLEIWPASDHVVNIKGVELFDMLDAKRVRPATALEEPPGDLPPGSAAPAPSPDAQVPTPAPAPVSEPRTQPPMTSRPPAEPVRVTPIDESRESAEINAVLDDFHDAAAKAEFDRYFAHFAPEGVFLGTDATERWNLAAFKAFARPHFDSGKGWAYRSTQRTVTLSPVVALGAEVAWFDELLANDKLGVTRGSGVLRKVDGVWKVCQYNLSIPIPNDLADETVKRIAEAGERPDAGSPAATKP